MRIDCRLVAAALAFAATAASAQPDPAAPPAAAQDDSGGNTIVVTGSAAGPSRKEVYDQALSISRIDPRSSYTYQNALARFERPVCPAVFGLSGAIAGEISQRIRANAGRVKAKLAKDKCSPNLLVVFAEDGQDYLGELARKYPQLFGLVDEPERNELLSGKDPVRVWSNIFPRSLVSTPVYRWKGKWYVPTSKGSVNKMTLASRNDIDSAVVVFDREAVLGMSAVQLADYATMRGLAHTRPATGDERMSTILGLFAEGAQAPEELTSFDLGYLESLYWWVPNVSAADKLLGVRKRAKQAQEDQP